MVMARASGLAAVAGVLAWSATATAQECIATVQPDVAWGARPSDNSHPNSQLRLGWSHEYADTARPVSATLAGAPAMPFTTFGVAPQRDGVVLGLSANTVIAEATSIYLRYEGDISGQDNAHALTAGVRMSW